MALVNLNQVKGGQQLVTDVAAKLDKSAVTGEGSETASDDRVLSEKAVEEKIVQLKNSVVEHVEESVTVEDAVTEITLSRTPTDAPVKLLVNGVAYGEGQGVTVDRESKKVTWVGEFPLNTSTVDSLQLLYVTVEKNPAITANVYGMILAQEGNRTGTWVRVDKDFNTVEFDATHGTWAGMKTVNDATYGSFVEIPVTYVKTETLTSGPYAGKNCWWTADAPMDGFHVHPAFIGQDGQPHNLQVASYIASNKSGTPYSEDKGTAADGYWNNISYNDVHAKGWMTGGARPYSIYDHHLLARLMLTEFGTPDVQAQTVDGVAWTGANRISYHGIYDPFGTPSGAEYYWLDGLTILNGTYQALAANGSRTMVETGVSCPDDVVWPTNCRVDQVNGINFGDLFIANSSNNSENSGSFADYQILYSGCAFYVNWDTNSSQGAFYLGIGDPTITDPNNSWRLTLCTG